MHGERRVESFAFGHWQVLPERRQLLAAGEPVPVGSRAFDLLVALAAAEGAVVTKTELLAAIWPGMVVEESNLQAQVSALRKALGPDGAAVIANVPGRGYRLAAELLATGPRPPAAPSRSTPALPDRPSLAVLPFRNLSADPEQEYFADGMAEEVTTALSRVEWLFVIARNSSFAYKRRAVDVTEIGRELGVRYIVDGSVRRAAGRVRITSQLVEAETRAEIWAERFDGGIDDVFDLQDRVSASIVGAIEPRLRRAELLRARAKPTERLDAYDHYLRALSHLLPRTAANYRSALRDLEAAMLLDPDFALAMALAAHCRYVRIIQGWAGDAEGDLAAMTRLAEAALDREPDDPGVLAHAGFVLGWADRGLAASLQLLRRALELDPNSAFAYYVDGWLRMHAGEPDIALERCAWALRLSPRDPLAAAAAMSTSGLALILAGRFDEAVDWGDRAVREAPDFAYPRRVHAAALALAGRLGEARAAGAALVAIEPGFTVDSFVTRIPLRATQANRLLFDGLRRAGLPER
jgi:TolB-like protein/Flp pilus assembly protein TadD